MAANNSYEEAVALIAAANRVVQDPNSVGTALRTISLRLRGTSVKELEEAGEDTTGAIESTSKLRSKVKSLSGVDILTATGAYKSTYDVLLDISKVWKNMSDIDQAALLELLAGKNRANTLAAILGNTKDLEAAYKSAMEAEGSAYSENEKYLNSIQGRIDLFNNAVQTLWSNILKDDVIKSVVVWGTKIIKSLDTTRGKILAIVKAVALLMAYKKINPVDWMMNFSKNIQSDGVLGTLKNLGASLLGIQTVTRAVTAETIANTIATKTNNVADQQAILEKIGLAGATGTLNTATKETIANNIAKLVTDKAMTIQMGQQTSAMLGYTLSVDAAGKATVALDTTTKSFMSSNPVGWILLIVSAVMMLVTWVSQIPPKIEKLTEELNELKTELGDIQSELGSVNSELETTQERISELLAKDKLSFTEKEELDNLKKQNDELQRKLDLLNLENKQKREQVAKTFVETMDEKTSNSKEYYSDGSKVSWLSELGFNWGSVQGGYTKHPGYESLEQTLTRLMQEYENAQDDRKAEIETEIGEKFDELKSMSEDIDYFTGDKLTDTQKESNQWLDYINNMRDSWAIVSGGDNAKSNAIKRLLNKEEFKTESKTLNEYADALKNGDASAKQSIEDFVNKSDALQNAVNQINGLELQDIIDFLTMFITDDSVDIVDNSSISDPLSKISALEDAYNSLGDALKEFKEEGIASADTLEGLSETFGKLDGFDELYTTLATGEGDVEAAITKVANAYIGQMGTLSDLSAEERKIMLARLESLGVINAEEVMLAKQVAQETLDTQYQQYGIDLSNYATAEAAKLAIAQQAGLDVATIQGNTIEELETKYGMDLSNYASVAEAKMAIAQELAKKEAATQKMAVAKEIDAMNVPNAVKIQMKEEEFAKIDALLPDFDSLSNIQSIVDDYYSSVKFDFSGNKIGIGSDYKDKYTDKATKEAADAFQKEMDYWENRIGANQSKYEQIQNEIDLLEKQGKKAGAEYYEEQIELEKEHQQHLKDKLADAMKYQDSFVEGSDEWWEWADVINGIENEIDGVVMSIQDLNDAIAEVNWYQIEEPLRRLGDYKDTLANVRDIIAPNGEEDWFDDEGMWTDKGTAVIGSYVQEIMFDEQGLAKAQDVLSKLSQPYEGNEEYYKSLELGIDSEQDLYDKRAEYQKEEQEYTQNIINNQQAIVDGYESQIDKIEDYTSKLVDSYNDYIDVVKEALDAERDLYEFKKDIQKQTKDIASLERRISSLSGADDAASVAERRKLEAELLEAKEGLNDTYRDHAKDSQQQALDDEAQAYEESMNKYIETLRTTLEEAMTNMAEFMTMVGASVMANAETVKNEYTNTGLTLDAAIIDPWNEAITAMQGFETNGLSMMNAWTAKEGVFDKFKTDATTALESPWSAAVSAVGSFKTSTETNMNAVTENIKTNVQTSLTELNKIKDLYSQIKDTSVPPPNTGSGDGNGGNAGKTNANFTTANIQALQKLLNLGFNAGITEDGKWGPQTEAALKKVQQRLSAWYNNNTDGRYTNQTRQAIISFLTSEIEGMRKLGSSSAIGQGIQQYQKALGYAVPAFYASGTLGTKKDQWAVTDEIGDELVMYATPEGRLSYMRAGSTVVPHDLTKELINIGEVGLDGLRNIPQFNSGVSLNSNWISKPELNLTFDSFVHVDNCSQDTLKDLEKMVDNKINQFSKQLNYSLKRFSR